MTAATTWNGRAGSVILGPTEHRVARWLADRTRHGMITIRTVAIAEALHLERSEAYRILARLRELGLFGISSDRGGSSGGRRIWRTAIEHDGRALDAVRHREAWARIVGWAAAVRLTAAARLARIREHMSGDRILGWSPDPASPAAARAPRPAQAENAAAGATFLERLIAGGLAPGVITLLAEHRHR